MEFLKGENYREEMETDLLQMGRRTEVEVAEGVSKEGDRKELKCVTHMYKYSTINLIIRYYRCTNKDTLIKKKCKN